MPDDAPVTVRLSVPVVVDACTFATFDHRLLLLIVMVAVGTPTKNTFLKPAPADTVVVLAKPIVTVAAALNQKLCDVVVMDAVVVVMVFVPVSAPATESPKPADVSVDDTTVSAVAEAAPA
jgi:hypothetical protein